MAADISLRLFDMHAIARVVRGNVRCTLGTAGTPVLIGRRPRGTSLASRPRDRFAGTCVPYRMRPSSTRRPQRSVSEGFDSGPCKRSRFTAPGGGTGLQERAATVSRSKRPLWLACIAILSCGCTDAGRWDRFAGGGSFIGCRPSMSPDGSWLVYSSPATGHGDIYRAAADGSKRVRLTCDPEYEGSPMISFDGTRICYMREDKGLGHIWIMDHDGRNQRQLTRARESDEDPSFSHDGSKIVFCRRFRDPLLGFSASRAELCVIATDGSAERRLTDNETTEWEPTFTPDDRAVIYSNGDEVWVLRLDTRERFRVATGSSPNGASGSDVIVFVGGTYGRQIRAHDLRKKSTRTLYASRNYLSSPSFCKNDSRVIFLEEPSANGTGSICLIDLKGEAKTIIAATGSEERRD
jgi:Tol biopolymer transport system component